jgi:hypothetical protein
LGRRLSSCATCGSPCSLRRGCTGWSRQLEPAAVLLLSGDLDDDALPSILLHGGRPRPLEPQPPHPPNPARPDGSLMHGHHEVRLVGARRLDLLPLRRRRASSGVEPHRGAGVASCVCPRARTPPPPAPAAVPSRFFIILTTKALGFSKMTTKLLLCLLK